MNIHQEKNDRKEKHREEKEEGGIKSVGLGGRAEKKEWERGYNFYTFLLNSTEGFLLREGAIFIP